jgi:hypothetical protein
MFNSTLKTILAAATATLSWGAIATTASAYDFVPQQEGEINVGLGCYDGCIELDPIFESITSLTDSSTGSRSRLFVDNLATKSTYNSGQTVFQKKDAGTNFSGFFFRPSEYNESNGYAEENGQLEVGTFEFTFSSVISALTIDFFDTESKNTTGALAINGTSLIPDYVSKGRDGNLVSQTFFDVKSITLKFGNDTASGTGDGVNFKMAGEPAVGTPEPGTIAAGLMASSMIAAARKRQKRNG